MGLPISIIRTERKIFCVWILLQNDFAKEKQNKIEPCIDTRTEERRRNGEKRHLCNIWLTWIWIILIGFYWKNKIHMGSWVEKGKSMWIGAVFPWSKCKRGPWLLVIQNLPTQAQPTVACLLWSSFNRTQQHSFSLLFTYCLWLLLSSCNRDYLTHKAKVFTVWPFTKSLLWWEKQLLRKTTLFFWVAA